MEYRVPNACLNVNTGNLPYVKYGNKGLVENANSEKKRKVGKARLAP